MVKNLAKLLLLFLLLSLNNIGNTSSLFFNTSTVSENSITAGCWVAPSAPLLNLPGDNLITKDSTIIFSWFASSASCPTADISYKYEISDDVLFSNIIVTSNWATNLSYSYPNIPEGKYYWRVSAKDQLGNISTSSVRSLTVDKTLPDSEITHPFNSNGDNKIQYTYVWNGKVKGTSSDNLSGVDHIELSIYRSILDLYWNGSSWVHGSETGTRVTAVGATSWEYQFNNQPPFGRFRIIAHAVDKAGNIENSATIEFENAVPETPVETTPTPTPTPVPVLEINLSANHANHKINLEVSNVSPPLDYEILYTGNGLEKGISGHINSNEIINSKYSKDFYLGTCSSGGGCTPEIIDTGSVITVNLTGSETLIKTFSY